MDMQPQQSCNLCDDRPGMTFQFTVQHTAKARDAPEQFC